MNGVMPATKRLPNATVSSQKLMIVLFLSGATTSSADLLTDLKSGSLLGANPRKQFLAHSAGIIAGGWLMGVMIALWANGGDMLHTFFGH
jgi:uncharacterized oligopeptide transporter (OPT) family protein